MLERGAKGGVLCVKYLVSTHGHLPRGGGYLPGE